jgi:hypothetical protein
MPAEERVEELLWNEGVGLRRLRGRRCGDRAKQQ